MKTLIIIPSRLSATRLPGKPLIKINGLSIISHVFKKAVDAKIGEVFVAAEDQEIVDDVKKNGGQAILTSNKHQSGTDRVYEAFKKLNKPNIEMIINLQGDEPLMNLQDIRNLHNKMINTNSMIGTLASKISDKNLYVDENVVKVIAEKKLENFSFPKALDFFRKSSEIYENIYHHLGIYCFQKETLEKFISLDQTNNEKKNRLEQLRALDNNIDINVSIAEESPIGVDTENDLVAIKKIMEYKS